MKKEWRYLVYQGKEYVNFSVSNLGEIRNNRTSKILKPSTNKKGYFVFVVRLANEGKKSGIVAHRAVAETFIDNPFDLLQVNHKDGNKQNNKVDNLEWCNCVDNVQHAIRNRLHTFDYCSGELSNLSKLNAEQVMNIRRLYKKGDYTQESLASMFNCSRKNISSIVNNKSWRHLGDSYSG